MEQNQALSTKVSCWVIYHRPTPPVPENTIVYYSSSWDVVTNDFLRDKDMQEKINKALATYPNQQRLYSFHYVEQEGVHYIEDEQVRNRRYKNSQRYYQELKTSDEGVLSCVLPSDRGRNMHGLQRVLICNIEGCSEPTIITAIRAIAKFTDKMRMLVDECGYIPRHYCSRWWVDLSNPKVMMKINRNYADWFIKYKDWLSGDYRMDYDDMAYWDPESKHLCWIDSREIDESCEQNRSIKQFIQDPMDEVYYLTVLNFPQGLDTKKLRMQENTALRNEVKEVYISIYKYIYGIKTFTAMDESAVYKELFDIDEGQSKTHTPIKTSSIRYSRSTINTHIKDHSTEKNSFLWQLYAEKVKDYYGIDEKGQIKANRATYIGLPKELFDPDKYNERLLNMK